MMAASRSVTDRRRQLADVALAQEIRQYGCRAAR
jgi:hypothetical protein